MDYRLKLAPAALASLACQEPEQYDYGTICASTEPVDDGHELVIEASSRNCAADHRGARFECSVSLDDSTVIVETVFQDGKDPDDACAGPLYANCTLPLEAGDYSLSFASYSRSLNVPSNERFCLPGGGDYEL